MTTPRNSCVIQLVERCAKWCKRCVQWHLKSTQVVPSSQLILIHYEIWNQFNSRSRYSAHFQIFVFLQPMSDKVVFKTFSYSAMAYHLWAKQDLTFVNWQQVLQPASERRRPTITSIIFRRAQKVKFSSSSHSRGSGHEIKISSLPQVAWETCSGIRRQSNRFSSQNTIEKQSRERDLDQMVEAASEIKKWKISRKPLSGIEPRKMKTSEGSAFRARISWLRAEQLPFPYERAKFERKSVATIFNCCYMRESERDLFISLPCLCTHDRRAAGSETGS